MKSSQTKNRFIPSLEALEDRCLLSSVIDWNHASDGHPIVTVWGTSNGDMITIMDDGRSSGALTRISCDGGVSWSIGFATEFRVVAGGGNDIVNYILTHDLASSRLINIDLGDGNDTFTANLAYFVYPTSTIRGSDLLAGANLALTVRGGFGKDTINVYADWDVDINAGAILSLNLAGEGGDDDIGVFYNGRLDGTLAFIADGGANNDTVRAYVTLDPDSEGTLGDPIRPAQVRGGDGEDQLTFLLADHSGGGVDIFAVLDCGLGLDEANSSNRDTINIVDDGSSGFPRMRISCDNGVSWSHGGATEFRVLASGGNDIVTYLLTGDLESSRLLNIDLGGGDDTFTASLSHYEWSPNFGYTQVGSDLLAGANLVLTVRGGIGKDTMNVYANRDVDINAGAMLSLNLAGEGGDDDIGVFYNGRLDGTLAFIADGGANNDTVRAFVTLDAGSGGTLGDPIRPAQVRGGDGDDKLTFLLADNSVGGVDIFAVLDCGPGLDEAAFTNNVDVIW